ncbi:MAG TPA: DMT family transporter [Bradyrhizobium sp.]|nr:DMT family transporter [Bradyrhizobium sp.]
MTEADSDRRIGTALVIAAAVAWSTAALFTRLLALDAWTILFWRGLFGGGLITAFHLLLQGRAGLRDLVRLGRGGWLVASLSTLGMVAFIPALQTTNVANVAVIIATQPFVAAALAWLWFRERARMETLLASLVALTGVAIIVSDAQSFADISGIGLACIMILAVSGMTVAIRRYRKTSMVAAAAMSNFLGSLVSIPFAHDIVGVTGHQVLVLAMFGCCQVALGLTFFTLGSRHLPSGQASLIGTLETPLMPFWIWLAFAELPTARAFVGGALVMGAVVFDIVGSGRMRARQARSSQLVP